MIELIDVSKFYVTEIGRHYVFRDVSLRLPFDKSVAVIGPNGAGKSTFMRLLGGADVPSEGRIIRTGRISPPMGLTPGLQSSLSAAENARFAGRIYGLMRDEINDLIDHVRETADIGKFFDLPVSSYSAGMKQRVAFAINMSLDFDYYLFDEIAAGGDREFRKYSKAKVQERLATSKFIIASHRSDELLDLCDAGIVIKDGELTFFDDVKDALAAYSVDDDMEGDESPRGRRRRNATEDDEAGTDRKSRKDKILEREARREEKRKARAAEAAEQDAVDAEPLEEAELEAIADTAELAGDDIERREEQPDERTADGGEDTGRAANRKSRKDKILERQARREEKRKARGTETAVTDPVASAPPETEDNDEATGPERSPEATPVVFLAADTEPQKDFSKPSSIEHLAPRLEFRRQPKTHELAGVGDAEDVSDLNAEYDSKRVLRLALLRQERAQVKSARALRLLLQHLDHQSENRESATWSARATIVAAAQESAASESAQARSLLHVRAPGGKSSAPESNHPSGSPLLTPGPETSRNSPDF